MSEPAHCPVFSDIQACLCETPVSDGCRALRKAFGQFATGVTVVAAIDETGQPFGLTINSFASLSMEPPLTVWSLTNSATDFARFCAVERYSINVLSAGQIAISNRFASRGIDRFAGVEWQPGLGGAPLLAGCCAHFEVLNLAQHAGGDHHLFVGRVERFAADPDRPPLVFHGGCYRRLDGGG